MMDVVTKFCDAQDFLFEVGDQAARRGLSVSYIRLGGTREKPGPVNGIEIQIDFGLQNEAAAESAAQPDV